jgi:hypothetical protein
MNFSVDSGGSVATAVAPGTAVQVEHDASGTGPFDRSIASKTCSGARTAAPVGASSLAQMTFPLSGPATIFPDDSLPTSLGLGDFTQRSASLEFTDGTTGPSILALIESLTMTVTVPEPARLALLGLEAGALVLRRCRPSGRDR